MVIGDSRLVPTLLRRNAEDATETQRTQRTSKPCFKVFSVPSVSLWQENGTDKPWKTALKGRSPIFAFR